MTQKRGSHIKLFLGVGILLALTACERTTYRIDRELQAQRFNECMAALPNGPSHLTASGNDWSDVVSACDRASRYMARVCTAGCSDESY